MPGSRAPKCFALLLFIFIQMLSSMQAQSVDPAGLPTCGCSSGQAATYLLSNGVRVVPNHLDCTGVHVSECSPIPGAEPSVDVCTVGDVDILRPGSFRLQSVKDSFGHWFSGEYARHLCLQGDQSYCDFDPAHARIEADVLDFGADPSGKQLQSLSKHVKGAVVGYNVRTPLEGYRPAASIHESNTGNYSLVFGERDGCLPFPDESFDVVFSFNVLEHVRPIEHYLKEAARLLRPGGLFYASYHPHWFSATGHHLQYNVMKDYLDKGVAEGNEACAGIEFVEDGSMVPHWGHLYLNAADFEQRLNWSPLGACPSAVRHAVHFVYYNDSPYGLNKVHVRDVMAYLENNLGLRKAEVRMQPAAVNTSVPYRAAEKIGARYGHGDVLFEGIKLYYTKPGAGGQHNAVH